VTALQEIRERDLWRCARCGRADSLHVHHRRKRSQGGSDSFANLVTLCSACHDWVHANQVPARQQGWLCSKGTDPAKVPVDHHAWPAAPVLLNADGTVTLWAA
jgi:hypothetical protein